MLVTLVTNGAQTAYFLYDTDIPTPFLADASKDKAAISP